MVRTALQMLTDTHPATRGQRTCPCCEDSPSATTQCCCGHIGPQGDERYVAALERDYHALREAVAQLAKDA